MLKLIVGLGNPGEKYFGTRHNVGFEAVDKLKSEIQTIACSSKFKAEICEAHEPLSSAGSGLHKFFILKPETFMNESGQPVSEFANYYKISADEVLVICDDVDLPVGHLRLSQGGSTGHQGVQSVIDNLGADFWRLRIGIGDNRAVGLKSEDYVLQKFKPEEKAVVEKSVKQASEVIKKLLAAQDVKTEIAEFNKSI